MSCKLYPQIKNKSGQLVDSTLYKEVLSLTKDRDLTKIIYSMVKSKETSSIFERRIISKYGEDLNSVKDENGEPVVVSQKFQLHNLEKTGTG